MPSGSDSMRRAASPEWKVTTREASGMRALPVAVTLTFISAARSRERLVTLGSVAGRLTSRPAP